MVFKPFLDLLASVFEVIVLLENNIIYGFDIELQGLLKFVFQYGHVEVPIHPSINLGCIFHLIPSHGTLHYQISTIKLHCSLHHLSLNPTLMSFHTYFLPSDPKQLILVSSDHMTFFQSSIVHSKCFSTNFILALLW